MALKTIEDHLVDTLSDSLQIAVCSESNRVISSLTSFFSRFPMFKTVPLRSADEVDSLFKTQAVFHCIVIDVGFPLREIFFDRITGMTRWIPVVILSDTSPAHLIDNWGVDQIGIEKFIHRNLKNRKKGCIVEICRTGRLLDMASMVLANSLKKKIFDCVPDDLVNEALDVLYSMNPITVDEWISLISCNTRKLQRHLKLFTDLGPRHILAVYHAYRIAFSRVDNSGNFHCRIFLSHTIGEDQRKRFTEYVLSRRGILL